MIENQGNRLAKIRQTFLARLALPVGAGHFRAVPDIPWAVSLDYRGEFVAHLFILPPGVRHRIWEMRCRRGGDHRRHAFRAIVLARESVRARVARVRALRVGAACIRDDVGAGQLVLATLNRAPSAPRTAAKVCTLGLPLLDSARYRLSRFKPECAATLAMPPCGAFDQNVRPQVVTKVLP